MRDSHERMKVFLTSQFMRCNGKLPHNKLGSFVN